MDQVRPQRKAQRHPTCPYCQYNLRGHFERTMRMVRCPECGEYLEASEVRWSHRRGDWTVTVGLRRAVIFLLVRGAVVLIILAASIIVLELLGEVLARNAAGFIYGLWTILLVQILFGIPAGKALSTGFEDAAGFSSLLLPLLSTTVLVVVAIILTTFLPQVWSLTYAPLQLMLFIACAVAVVVIIVDYLRDIA